MSTKLLLLLSATTATLVSLSQGRNILRSAPEMCPIDDGNLLDVELFVADEEDCYKLCEKKDGCNFYRYYSAMEVPQPLDDPDQSLDSLPPASSASSGDEDAAEVSSTEASASASTNATTAATSTTTTTAAPATTSAAAAASARELRPSARQMRTNAVRSKPSSLRPTQCFLFRTCGRKVERAGPDCALNKENTIQVVPFVPNDEHCRDLCQEDRECGYFKYFPTGSSSGLKPLSNPLLPSSPASSSSSGSAPALIGTDAQADNATSLNALARISSAQDVSDSSRRDEFCYVLRSCSKRMVDNVDCAMGKNNFLDVRFFVPSLEQCATECAATDGCRYYSWHPIDHSETPLYCFLYQQCAAGDKEPEVAFIMGGRHPGHYFFSNQLSSDVVMRNDVCSVGVSENVSLSRAGSSSEFLPVSGLVLFCGGRNAVGVHRDCLQFDPVANEWKHHSDMIKRREEASCTVAGTKMFVFGGVGEASVEVLEDTEVGEDTPTWKEGPELPKVIARSCAATVDKDTIIVAGGHDNTSTNSLSSVYQLSVSSGEWTPLGDMRVPRRDHACIFVEFEDERGLLVTGGLGDNDEVLDSAEFYDVDAKKWTLISPLKQARTEHAMSLVYGIPTVMGGLTGTGFLSSLEQLDKSSASWNVPLGRDWRTINHALTTPRYEMAVASVPVSRIKVCDSDLQ